MTEETARPASDVARLRALARMHGVQTWYMDAAGALQQASTETLIGTLRALGAPLEGPADVGDAIQARAELLRNTVIEPVHVAWDGHLRSIEVRDPDVGTSPLQIHIYLEDGGVRSWTVQPQPVPAGAGFTVESCARLPIDCTLPLGYHRLEIETPARTAEATIISAPRRAFVDERRSWGVFAPLYALHSARSWGIGDFTDLGRLLEWTGERGGNFVGTLPLLAAFLEEPFEPSPYAPASRLFWNELYIDPERLPGAGDGPGVDVRAEWLACRAGRLVDYRHTAAMKRQVLNAAAVRFFEGGGDRSADWQRFLAAYPAVEAYARFRAVGDRQRTGWPAWPERLRGGTIEAGDYDPADERYHLFAQYSADRQLAEVAGGARTAGARLYLDLPIGVHGDSFDVWRQPELFARGASAGAPADALFSGGQDWGFPPLNPDSVRRDGYRYISDCIRHHLRYAGMLRLDHVMALRRLYWVPAGLSAKEGAYVRYPQDEWVAMLTLESVRHQATIIGEDLGTVPPEVREAMDRHAMQRMHVVQFEATSDGEPPIPDPPEPVIASLNTHDMPTFAAYWRGSDIEDQLDLGLTGEGDVRERLAARARLRRRAAEQLGMPGEAMNADGAAAALPALLAHLARSDARAVILNLEDLWLETEPQNVPGTSTERPNWRRRLRLDLEHITHSSDLRAALDAVTRLRAENSE
jgi:4-alpha-glucanotransferase